MSVMHSPDSEYAKERRRWETTHTEFGPPGRAAVFTEFPLMIYKASRPSAGGATPIIAHHIVQNEDEERNMRSRGFVRGPDHAVEMLEASERELATAAAERVFQEQRMSDKARTEAAAADDATSAHVGSVPETPIRRRVARTRKEVS